MPYCFKSQEAAREFAIATLEAFGILSEAFLRVPVTSSVYPLDKIESAQRYLLLTGVMPATIEEESK